LLAGDQILAIDGEDAARGRIARLKVLGSRELKWFLPSCVKASAAV
jgi:hypothetical protein